MSRELDWPAKQQLPDHTWRPCEAPKRHSYRAKNQASRLAGVSWSSIGGNSSGTFPAASSRSISKRLGDFAVGVFPTSLRITPANQLERDFPSSTALWRANRHNSSSSDTVTFIASQCYTKSREEQLVLLMQASTPKLIPLLFRRLGIALRGSRSGIRNGFRPAGVEGEKEALVREAVFHGIG